MKRLMAIALAASALLLVSQIDAASPARAGSAAGVTLDAVSSGESGITLQALVDEAQGGDAEAMNLLGVLYASTAQASGDYTGALFWFEKAIEGGSANAMNNLAVLYLVGTGVPRDYANAFRWFGRAAARGNASAAYSFATMADEGLGTARDPKLAHSMYRRAAELGVATAMVRVSDDYARGSGVARDAVEAYAWLQLAMQAGTPADMKVAVLAKMQRLEARLTPQLRDDARVRTAHLVSLVNARANPEPSRDPAVPGWTSASR